MRKNKCRQNTIVIEVQPCLLPLPMGVPRQWKFEPFLLLGQLITKTIHQSCNLRVDPTIQGAPMYAILLNRTRLVGNLTNQPNLIQTNVTSNKMQLFNGEQIEYPM